MPWLFCCCFGLHEGKSLRGLSALPSAGRECRRAHHDTVNALTPAGKTPLTAAVGQAAEVLHFRVKPALIVVLTDGEETCSGPRSGRLHEKHEQRAQSVQHEVQRGGN